MSLDERIKMLARQAIAETDPANPSGDLAAAVADYGAKLGLTMSQLDDLHKELHAVATRLAALEQAAEQPPTPRQRQARKATSE